MSTLRSVPFDRRHAMYFVSSGIKENSYLKCFLNLSGGFTFIVIQVYTPHIKKKKVKSHVVKIKMLKHTFTYL